MEAQNLDLQSRLELLEIEHARLKLEVYPLPLSPSPDDHVHVHHRGNKETVNESSVIEAYNPSSSMLSGLPGFEQSIEECSIESIECEKRRVMGSPNARL